MYSYPFDDPRNVLRRPDLIDFFSVVEPIMNLKLPVIRRSPKESIASLIRRKWWSEEMCQKGFSFFF